MAMPFPNQPDFFKVRALNFVTWLLTRALTVITERARAEGYYFFGA